jgi:hypothetical protein
MENKVLEPVEDRGKSAKQMEREGGEREAAAGRMYSDAAMKRDAMKKPSARKMKR